MLFVPVSAYAYAILRDLEEPELIDVSDETSLAMDLFGLVQTLAVSCLSNIPDTSTVTVILLLKAEESRLIAEYSRAIFHHHLRHPSH